MSWVDNELSLAQGKPLRLYEFRRGNLVWRYTAGDADIVVGGDIYSRLAISDNGIRDTGQAAADALEIIAPSLIPVAELYRGVPPSSDVGVILRGMHRGDTAAIVMWVGTITDVARTAADRCKITCQPLSTVLARNGLRMLWQRSCTHSIYDAHCGLDKSTVAITGVVDAIDGTTLSCVAILSKDNGWFTGGFVEWDIGSGEKERRTIELHENDLLRLLNTTDGLTAGLSITIYPGCNHTVSTCSSKFNNIDNYGGVPGLPGRSPFDGNPVF